MKNQPEYELQCAIAQYLRTAYPKVMFLSDVRAAMKLTIPQAVRSKKIQADGFACPDMMIFERSKTFGYAALFLELKAETPLKNGTLSTNKHIQNQAAAIERLVALGYSAHFIWDFDMARRVIDDYLREI